MAHARLRWLFIGWFIMKLVGAPVVAQPVWTFSVRVAVEQQTATYYQQATGQSIDQLVREQLATVSANFNSAGRFNGRYLFRADSIYVFSGPANVAVFRPHPNHTYGLVIDGFSDNSLAGGWWGDSQTIYHRWRWDDWGGPFAQYATDGLTHEFGHARGAVDLYAVQVDADKNPVNGSRFAAVNSLMNYPYGNVVWDDHTVNLLNSTADQPIVGDGWITKPFPATIGVKTVDASGIPLAGATIELYPVDWFSNAVTATAAFRGTTAANGIYAPTENPFRPGTLGAPWHIRYANFLVKATFGSVSVYSWMPVYEVQNAFFSNGAASAYTITIPFPADTPLLYWNKLRDTTYCEGSPVQVSFTTTGTFEAGNVFRLMLLDAFDNSYQLASSPGRTGTSLTGIIPDFNATGKAYRLRLVSTSPASRSSDYVIQTGPVSGLPSVPASTTILCQGAVATSLVATGTNLVWTLPSGLTSTVAPTPPTATTTALSGLFYRVAQTEANLCPSPWAPIRVVVIAPPALSLSGSTTANLGLPVPLKLSFAGVGPFSYRLSNGLSGTAAQDTTVLLVPERTTTYRASSVSNRCGVGKTDSTNEATVIVRRPTIETTGLTSNTLCVGGSLSASFVTTGTFNPGSLFRLQLARIEADSGLLRFIDVPGSTAIGNQVTGTLPGAITAGTYWVRVMATNPLIPVYGQVSPARLTIRPLATAVLSGAQSIRQGEAARLSIAFTGDAPWRVAVRDSSRTGLGNIQTIETATNPYPLTVTPAETTTYFLTDLENQCGSGDVTTAPVVVTVNPPLGVERVVGQWVSVYPVPATSRLTIRFHNPMGAQSAHLRLIDMAGRVVRQQETQQPLSWLSLEPLPAGLYLLQIQLGGLWFTQRIIHL